MEPSRQHVVVAGAGIIGLATALELLTAGFRVTVVERGRAMEQSSWAAAGMLAVHDPENAGELFPLSLLSHALYPGFLARVEALSGLSIPLRTTHTLQGRHAKTHDEEPPPELPTLRTDRYSYTLLEETSLDPRDLCTALPRAVISSGALLRQGTGVISVGRSGGHVSVELENGDVLAADHFVLASGAWSGQLALPGTLPLPVAPRKGQMIEVTLHQTSLDRASLPVVIRTPELYLVPRGDGRVVIGATVERAGFDRSVDESAGDRLWRAAAALWPPVLEGRITARWTGLRPGFRQGVTDRLPVIGQFSDGLWVATAHFRNGILLAPGTAHVLRQLICGEAPATSLAAFAPQRFAQAREVALAEENASFF